MILNILYFFLDIKHNKFKNYKKWTCSLDANSSIISSHLENMIDINQLFIKNDERSKNILGMKHHSIINQDQFIAMNETSHYDL